AVPPPAPSRGRSFLSARRPGVLVRECRMQRATPLLAALVFVGCGGASVESGAKPIAKTEATTIAATETVDPAPPPRDDGRLPPGTRPLRYALDLHVDPSKPSFDGHTRIAVALDRPTRAIVLHGRGLTVRSATLTTPRGKL